MDICDEMDNSDDLVEMDIGLSETEGKGARPCTLPIPMPSYLEKYEFGGILAKRKFDGIDFKDSTRAKRKEVIKDVVMMHALPFLPAKALLRFRSVSKEWNTWIARPLMAHQQGYTFQKISGYFCQDAVGSPKFFSLDNAAYGVPCPSLSFLPEDRKVLSSCNGLLLCQDFDSYYVVNPTTKDWKRLPNPIYFHGFFPAVVLAFEPSVQNIEAYYQVICAISTSDPPMISFEIYSSKTRSWRCSAAICTELVEDSSVKGPGFYMNGNAYWETESGHLLAFNVQDEETGIISIPPEASKDGTFTVVGPELCYVTIRNHCKNSFAIDIYGGMVMSLKHTIFLNLELWTNFSGGEWKVVPGIDGDYLLILTKDYQICLHSYHFSDQKVQLLCRQNNISFSSRFLPYINTLVSVA